MKTPFANFFKNVFRHNDVKPNLIDKPVEQVKEEKREPVRIPVKVKSTRRPVFKNKIEALKRHRRSVRNRMQKRSRVINRNAK